MTAAIRVEGLGKSYRVAHNQPRAGYRTLRETLMGAVTAPLRRWRNGGEVVTTEEFWALQDVSFEVQPGEVVGIIGRNGAGKSTLLKVLSRITKPTKGRVELNGRVGSLLEVGTGFHPELTGRENIYLNGSILGMSRKEIDRRFDEIVAFAEVEKFLDTPVKRYSSGMYVRLAFAVAAHLEPEILVVDEVLAVGDAAFQRKCLNKMEDVGRGGRTILFVSHNMAAVTRLCRRSVLLADGSIEEDGPSDEVAATYLNTGFGGGAVRRWDARSPRPGNEIVSLVSVAATDGAGRAKASFDIRNPIYLEVEYQVHRGGHVLVPNFHVFTEEGTYAFVIHDLDPAWRKKPRPPGMYKSIAEIPGNFLSEETLIVGVAISTHDPFAVHVYERDAIAFRVIDTLEGETARGDYVGHMPGVVRPALNWRTEFHG
jgi:lipopolysaccharide transport system ATP-binding protein